MDTIKVDFIKLRSAIESSWRPDTAYQFIEEEGNPALGQCYVTSLVIQYFFPECEIIKGEVNTDHGIEKHYWNMVMVNGEKVHIDLTWRQFPLGSTIKSWQLKNRGEFNDDKQLVERFEKLLTRVKQNLNQS
ncbi:MAG: hypothetical protein U0516_00005 [Candidatus Saccharibacteria bacterium]